MSAPFGYWFQRRAVFSRSSPLPTYLFTHLQPIPLDNGGGQLSRPKSSLIIFLMKLLCSKRWGSCCWGSFFYNIYYDLFFISCRSVWLFILCFIFVSRTSIQLSNNTVSSCACKAECIISGTNAVFACSEYTGSFAIDIILVLGQQCVLDVELYNIRALFRIWYVAAARQSNKQWRGSFLSCLCRSLRFVAKSRVRNLESRSIKNVSLYIRRNSTRAWSQWSNRAEHKLSG